MTDFHTAQDLLPHIPDNLTIAQFMLDYQHDIRPTRNSQMPCIVDDKSGRIITFESLRSQTEDLANGLYLRYSIGSTFNFNPPYLPPSLVDYPLAIWAVHKLGGIVSFSNPQFKPDEVAYQLKTARVNYMVVHSSLLAVAMEATRLVGMPSNRIIILDEPPTRGPEFQSVPDLISHGRQKMRAFHERQLGTGEGKTKVALLCWSSGTTGKPKAVAIPHRALIANIIQMAVHQQVDKALAPCNRESRSYRPGDVALVLPFYHVAGLLIGLHLTVFCAMTVVVFPSFDFPSLLESIFRHRISHLILVPPMAINFWKHPAAQRYNFKNIKFVLIGAAPVSRDMQEKLGSIFPAAQIGQAYGLTEMTTTLSMVSGSQRRGPLGSGGRLLPGIQAKVIKPDGTLARYGERGELLVRGPGSALGYLHNVAATKETFRDGWVHTGDEVSITSDQEVFVFDRLKEMIKVKGFQVAPSELEDCLLSHPDVAEACVVGIPDDYCGEVPLAYVVLKAKVRDYSNCNPGAINQLTDSIMEHVNDRKTSYKHLSGGIRFVDEIPKNGSGKMLRRVLRQAATLGSFAQPESKKGKL
ncbi:hypothetical protein GALMADRAFT_57372 [Galerina marginata CBS 339.88]|uniref:AMP-dependent synthetase/ligase domain-containing protein n=1 Tax=Galerina marginata (strain CBS 339.88) TaxID=685588 RepID=A0A067TJ11_GALM3|nr:hypothetical protein GALMADRAFT_57372 [Galerina marginata CBS 339.88]